MAAQEVIRNTLEDGTEVALPDTTVTKSDYELVGGIVADTVKKVPLFEEDHDGLMVTPEVKDKFDHGYGESMLDEATRIATEYADRAKEVAIRNGATDKEAQLIWQDAYNLKEDAVTNG